MKKRNKANALALGLEELSMADVQIAGGKNASLGEMIRALKSKGINVPEGFAITSKAYWTLVEYNQLKGALQDAFNKL